MKTFVIAQHHGVFLTLQSMLDCGIEDIIVIIPQSQVTKYNKMYSENPTDPEFQVFKDYDKKISEFIKQSGSSSIKAYIFDDFDIRNTAMSTLKFINAYGCSEIVACVMSGSIVLRDYADTMKNEMIMKTFGACMTRVYQNDKHLSMYHMLGLQQTDKSVDLNFFVVDASKIFNVNLNMSDSEYLSGLIKKNQLAYISREYNGKDDVLIGSAISARQTIAHQLRMQSGYVINIWNKSIKPTDLHKSEEIFGYPFSVYKKYAMKVNNLLPISTVNKIVANGNETEKWTGGLLECMDIIDL